MKLISSLYFYLLLLLFTSCTSSSESKENWPQSGGPNGSWSVKTSHKVPTAWSVRSGKNIRWKTLLPEGGQSGIAVWGEKLFLTINPPLKTRPYVLSKAEYAESKKSYNSLYAATVKKLKGAPDFTELAIEKTTAEKIWNELLAGNRKYRNSSKKLQSRIASSLMKSTEQGKKLASAKRNYNNFILKQSQKLTNLYNAMKESEAQMNARGKSADIILYCLSAADGSILWTQTVKGTMEADYNYGFSDSTSPTPVTDGEKVWAVNASGGMACFSADGKRLWERTWMPTGGRPFNKQYDTILYENLLLNVEPPAEGDSSRVKEWNYLHAFDKNTGKRLWVTKPALTHYNTPVLGKTEDGKPAVLIGRGGPHGVPERPVGLSLISLENGKAGSEIWNWEPQAENKISGWGALSTQHWDTGKASWFYSEDHLTVDSKSGKLLASHKLNIADRYVFDTASGKYKLEENVILGKFQNQRHCNIMSGNYLFFMVRYEPFLARHNMKTGKNEHIELPRSIGADGKYIWKTVLTNDGLNSQGQMHARDSRTRGDGFQKCFLGSPIIINNFAYFTNALGITYVIDISAEKFDNKALVSVNDLGEFGKTWSVNSISYANGRLYHRSMKEVVCIEEGVQLKR